ncbi:MAG: hypothetical protein AB7I35_01255 [Ramlibacter sp.]
MTTITATLISWQGAGAADVATAEARFVALLSQAFGGLDKAAAARRAWIDADIATGERPRSTWPGELRKVIDQWEHAYAKAREIALDGLPGKGHEPWFDVAEA